eukprot:scaffold10.g2403.t1
MADDRGVAASAVENGKAKTVTQAFGTLASAEEDKRYEKEVKHSNAFIKFLYWVFSFVVPGLGMFSEAYFVFSIGKRRAPHSCVCWSKTDTGTCAVSYTVSDTLTFYYDPAALSAVWRLSYFLGLLPIMFMLLWRIYVLRESAVFLKKRASLRELGSSEKYTNRKNWLLIKFYGHRIAGCALSWFVWDFAFYGNKLFQSAFINATLEYILINSSVALVGYYFAAFTIDRRWMGRVRMQMMGFAWMFVLFLPCAVAYYDLTAPNSNNIKVFQFLYFFSSFWGQFGPNATTWLLPAETVPTETRAMCHGIAAAVGKAGALVAGVVFGLLPTCGSGLEGAVLAAGGAPGCLINSASSAAAQKAQKALITAAENQRNFYISAICGIAGLIVTFLLIPDLTGLDLKEGDKRWLAIINGDHASYDGPAVAPRHLSFVERVLFRYQRNYRGDAPAGAAPGAANGSDAGEE